MSSESKSKYQKEIEKVKGVEVRAFPKYKNVAPGLKTEMPLLVNILTGKIEREAQPRDPLHICIALDRSGSMSGNPLHLCKEAVKSVGALLEPEDRLSLVVYSDGVDQVFESVTSETFESQKDRIEGINSYGCTNISGALEESRNILVRSGGRGRKVVFLLSDGHANRGITALPALGAKLKKWASEDDVAFSTFGIGSGFDESWLQAVARSGHGNYFFIDKMEVLNEEIRKGINGFAGIVGENVVFRMTGAGDGQKGQSSTLLEINSMKDHNLLVAGKHLSCLREKGCIQLTAKYELTSGFEKEGEVVLAGYELSYDDALNDGVRVTQSGEIKLSLTTDATKLVEVTPEYEVQEKMDEAARLNEVAEEQLSRGDVAGALESKNMMLANYAAAAPLDKYGFSDAMAMNEQSTIAVIQKEGYSSRAQKMQKKGVRFHKKKRGKKQQEAWEDMDNDSDEDMAYDLVGGVNEEEEE